MGGETPLLGQRSANQPGEKLPSGELVADHYISIDEQGRSQAELAVPMIYHNHLVGVLNIENPFDVASPGACPARVRRRGDTLHRSSTNRGWKRFTTSFLAWTTSRRWRRPSCARSVNSSKRLSSSLFLWDIQEQGLKLEAASTDVINPEDLELESRARRDLLQAPGAKLRPLGVREPHVARDQRHPGLWMPATQATRR